MSTIRIAFRGAVARRKIAAMSAVILLLSAHAAQGQSLNFFKNYFVTGDYAVGGVGLKAKGLNGSATGTITVSGVPNNAVILSAFLYWTTIADNADAGHFGATFKGNAISSATQPNLAKILNPGGTTACSSLQGAKAFGYRMDVLRFLEQDPVTGRLIVNGQHQVQLPDSGNVNQLPLTLGASLFVMYRDPTKGLRAIVVYDGAQTMGPNDGSFTQTIDGLYQSQIPTPSAKLTPIVGGATSSSRERVLVGGTLVSTNPFLGTLGASWDSPSIQVTGKLPGNIGTTSVTVMKDNALDCQTFVAMAFTTSVQDADRDGIVDRLETTSNLTDPLGRLLPNLAAMGANPQKKDIFVEVGYTSTLGYTNPLQGQVAAHDHLPSLASLQTVTEAFANAPVSNPDGSTGIKLHFDVGNNYQSPQLPPFIIPAAYARGGEPIDEVEIQCTAPWDDDGDPNTPLQPCQFPDFPGTIAWKNAYRFLRDQPLNYNSEQECVAAGLLCERRFDQTRKDIFHYALYAHALGLPKSTDPNSPDFHIPRNVSGIADPPGGDLMVTLGLWGNAVNNYKGTDFVQASTLMHELGHNIGLRHGGQPAIGPNGVPVPEPNCKSNFQSIMNYLFQMQGLVCLANTTAPACLGKTGATVIDYSRSTTPALNENTLNEQNPGLGTLLYPTRWHAPKTNNILPQYANTTPLTRRCNGSPAQAGEQFVVIDGVNLTGPIDWNASGGAPSAVSFAQDINYSGPVNGGSAFTVLNSGSNDWFFVDLRQVGGRRNVGSERVGGALSLGVDWPDLGFGDTGFGDTGFGDTGFGDTGFGDTGFGDTGFGDTGFGDTGAPLGDLDLDTALSVPPKPNEIKSGAPATATRVTVTWQPPNYGNVLTYELFRVVGTVVDSSVDITALGTIPPSGGGGVTFVDNTVRPNTTYTYFVVANFDNGTSSGPSNYFTITTPNVQ